MLIALIWRNFEEAFSILPIGEGEGEFEVDLIAIQQHYLANLGSPKAVFVAKYDTIARLLKAKSALSIMM